jgi:anti-anti-sigma regulatory factor
MLRIQRTLNGDETVLKVSGRMDAENVAELEALFASEAKGRRMTMDLEDLTLASREAVRFLERCESDGIKLVNCPLYIREWILRERNAK